MSIVKSFALILPPGSIIGFRIRMTVLLLPVEVGASANELDHMNVSVAAIIRNNTMRCTEILIFN